MIMSVSTLTIGSGAATPVSFVNLSIALVFRAPWELAVDALHSLSGQSKRKRRRPSTGLEVVAHGATFSRDTAGRQGPRRAINFVCRARGGVVKPSGIATPRRPAIAGAGRAAPGAF